MPRTSTHPAPGDGRQVPLLDDEVIGSLNGAQEAAAKPRASIASVAFVLLNTCLGSGMLGLPGAFARCGLVGGLVIMFVAAGLSVFGVHLISQAADRAGRPASFYSVATLTAGPKAGVLIDVLIALNAFGCATSYIIVVGDVLPEVAASFNAPPVLQGRTLWMLVSLAVGAPLAFLRNLSALRFTAYAAFLCVLYIAGVVGIFAILPDTFHPCGTNATTAAAVGLSVGDSGLGVSGVGVSGVGAGGTASCGGSTRLFPDAVLSAIDAFPIFIFAFTCHQNAIPITNELARPSPRRVLGATVIAITLALFVYSLVGVGGYATYGSLVASDILKSYPEKSLLPLIGRIAIAFVVTTCYPMQVHPGRGSLVSLVARILPHHTLAALGGEGGTTLHVLATSVLVAATIGTALAVTSLGVMLTIIGALCSTSVTFIVPGGCYVALFPEGGWRRPKRVLALVQLILGLIIAPLCLALTFVHIKQ